LAEGANAEIQHLPALKGSQLQGRACFMLISMTSLMTINSFHLKNLAILESFQKAQDRLIGFQTAGR
jgi:hypothetical protein